MEGGSAHPFAHRGTTWERNACAPSLARRSLTRLRMRLGIPLAFFALLCCAACDPVPFSDGRVVWEIAAADGRFVAVGEEEAEYMLDTRFARVWTSSDGATWTQAYNGPRGALRAVAYGGGRWLAVGEDLIVASDDGLTWEAVDVPEEALGASGVAFHEGVFLVVTGTPAGNRIGRTPDGRSWEWLYEGESWYSPGIQARGGTVVVYGDGPSIAYSTDQTTWAAASTPAISYVRSAIATDRGFFAEAVSDSCFGEDPSCIDRMFLRSDDGVSWTRLSGPPVAPSCDVPEDEWTWPAPSRGTLVRMGDVRVTVRCPQPDGSSPRRYSLDGRTWQTVELPRE